MDVNGSGYQQFNCETVSSIRNLIKIDQIFDPLRQILSLEVATRRDVEFVVADQRSDFNQ